MNEYENTRRLVYGEGAHFVPVCETCGRFVKADKEVLFDAWDQPKGPNATCKKCGRVQMLWEGWY
jgi:uncharacterized Zn finger protein